MTINSLLRNWISIILCGLILSGQTAAWVHVVTCQHHERLAAPGVAQSGSESGFRVTGLTMGSAGQGLAEPGEDAHRCCTHHHDNGGSGQTDNDAADHQRQAPADSHDSEHCAVCQSLATAGGVLYRGDVSITVALIPDRWLVIDSPAVDRFAIAFPHLRGPPLG